MDEQSQAADKKAKLTIPDPVKAQSEAAAQEEVSGLETSDNKVVPVLGSNPNASVSMAKDSSIAMSKSSVLEAPAIASIAITEKQAVSPNTIEDGEAEAIVRSLAKSLLTRDKYESFTIEALDLTEFKVMLEDTDYAKYIQTIDNDHIDPVELIRRMYEKLRDEIE